MLLVASRAVVVTLTSIPSRFAFLPTRLAKIFAQSVRPDAVEVYLPRRYRRFPEIYPVHPPRLPKGVELIWVDEDVGPATKILPAYSRWQGKEVDLLLCDDDRAQDRDWILRLLTARASRPNDIVCERGWNVDERFGLQRESLASLQGRAVLDPSGGRTLSYRLRRAFSLGRSHPPRRLYRSAGFVDVFEGFLGALIPPNAFDRSVGSIPQEVWMVDDVWLSGMAALAGTRIWVHDYPRPVYSDGKVDKIDSLRAARFEGNQRSDSDRQCAVLFRERYGIWL